MFEVAPLCFESISISSWDPPRERNGEHSILTIEIVVVRLTICALSEMFWFIMYWHWDFPPERLEFASLAMRPRPLGRCWWNRPESFANHSIREKRHPLPALESWR